MITKHKENNVKEKIKKLLTKTINGGKLKSTKNETEENETGSKAGRKAGNPTLKNKV